MTIQHEREFMRFHGKTSMVSAKPWRYRCRAFSRKSFCLLVVVVIIQERYWRTYFKPRFTLCESPDESTMW